VVSRLAAEKDTGDVLGSAEVAEMREHLAFLRRHKELLRLKLNATEDLLVNGRREPTERGVCRHLLGKVDRAVIDAALAREPLRSDPAARARMLAGAVRLTADVGVLLAYLEALADVRSRAEAAEAFAEVVRRIDFAALSPARLGRLLQVLVATFEGHERVQALFGLLAAPAFRAAFDAAAEAGLPPDVAAILAPLRAVDRRLTGAAETASDATLVGAGLEQLLAAPDPVLRRHPDERRVAILALALRPDVPDALADRAAGVLLPTLRPGSPDHRRLALRRAAQLLGRHADDRARVVLADLHRAEPGLRTAARWLAALDARRLDRVALEGELPPRGRLLPAFWLDGQRTVWVRTAPTSEASRLAVEARLQEGLGLPTIAPVVEHGVASGIPYVAVAAPGRPLAADALPAELAVALTLAAAVARTLRALALAGVSLPDAEPERFLLATPAALTLADLDGARREDSGAAEARHVALGAGFARRLLSSRPPASLPRSTDDALRRVLAEPPSLPALVAVLDRAALVLLRG
jgi:hypothetical protein